MGYGTPLAYPSQWKPDFYDSRLVKVAKCLVSDNFIYLSDFLESMGCASPPTPEPTTAPSDSPTSTPSDSPTISPTPAPSGPPTISPIAITCAVENEKSKGCGSNKGKDKCCDGLICHAHHKRCVPPENK